MRGYESNQDHSAVGMRGVALFARPYLTMPLLIKVSTCLLGLQLAQVDFKTTAIAVGPRFHLPFVVCQDDFYKSH